MSAAASESARPCSCVRDLQVEKATAGLLELIENDAFTCAWVSWEETGHPPPRIVPEIIPFDTVRELLERLRKQMSHGVPSSRAHEAQISLREATDIRQHHR